MSELENRLHELLRRTKVTTKSRYRASERLELHHKLSQWTVSLISVALVIIPVAQTFKVEAGVDQVYLNAIQTILAVLILVYSLLLGQENFVSRAKEMHRNGVELGRLARKLSGKGDEVTDEEYASLTEEYYDILEKYENHKPIDYLYTKLSNTSIESKGGVIYMVLWMEVKLKTLIAFSHYFAVIMFVGLIFIKIFIGFKVLNLSFL